MKKVYFDIMQMDKCISVYIKDLEVIRAGTSVYSMPVKHKNEEYQRFAKEYDIHFIFDDNVPKIDFYTIPQVDVFAVDSDGGYIGSLGQTTDIEGESPICYINKDKKCYLIATNGKVFLENADSWREKAALFTDIEFFESLEDAKKKYEFVDVEKYITD